ncbi:MAG: type II toxin-antitoxin system Phd/YefM family antitoxin [Deltaproteobacteria bacterium]|nr:type II toxin-antitoxin system Phd/YefM family antitoxin [Deltaproteobacteria bacterium]
MQRLPASEAWRDFERLIDDVGTNHSPVLIVGTRSNAVLVSEEGWRGLQETLRLVQVPGMAGSILEGLATPHEAMTDELEW